MSVFSHSAGLSCLAILFAAGCNFPGDPGDTGQPSSVSIAEALRATGRSPESTVFTRVSGVVSFADIQTGDFILEDSTGGIRLWLPAQQAPTTGDEVEATGVLQVTGETGVMLEPGLIKVGNSTRPRAMPVSLETLHGDTNRTVALRGVVESVELERSGVQTIIVRASGRRAISSMQLNLPDAAQLVDAEVEVVGVLARGAGPTREPLLWSRDPRDLKVLHPARSRTLIQALPLARILKTPSALTPGHRIRVQGNLVASSSGRFHVQDGTESIPVSFNQDQAPPVEGNADLVAFLNFRDGKPCLDEAESTVPAPENLKIVRSARELHLLPYRTAALNLPVNFRAVVTYSSPPLLFVQDSTDGVFVYPGERKGELRTGDLVDVRGISFPGDFAPSLGHPEITVLGRAPLPEPDADIEAAFTGKLDSRWVQFQGVLQQVEGKDRNSQLSLVWGIHAFKASVTAAPAELEGMLDREVTVRGVLGSFYNDQRQFLGVQLFVPGIEFIKIKPGGESVRPASRRSIKSLLQFSPVESGEHKVRVEGTVTLSNPAGPTFIRDDTGGLVIATHAAIVLERGDVVEVSGYPEGAAFGPAMRDGQLRKLRSGEEPIPIHISVDEAVRGAFESQLVEIEGVVASNSLQSANRSIVLRASPYLFEARLAVPTKSDALAAVSPGAHVVVRGIVSAIDDRHQGTVVPRGFQILLRSPADIVVTRRAPWFTTSRMGSILWGASLVVFGSVCWIMLLRRSVRLQTRSLVLKTCELETANGLANAALIRAREAESVEADRKAILELVARDEPLDCIMRAICEAAVRHLKVAACSIQLRMVDGSRLSESPDIPENIASALSFVDIDSIAQRRGFTPCGQLSSDEVWMAALPLLDGALLAYTCAAPVRRNRTTAGFMVAFAAAPGPPGPFEALALESWSNIANLAVERRGFFEQLCYRARHDNLTGLFNRASFSERLEAELAQTAQQDGGLAVIFLDLDGFKNINDLYGHDAGDAVLREISRRLRDSVRRTDTAARLGGDEFAVLLPGVDNREEAARIGKLIEDAVQIPVLFGDFELETGGSLGVALYPDDGMEPETLLKSADEDMYRKKSSHHARRQDHRAYA